MPGVPFRWLSLSSSSSSQPTPISSKRMTSAGRNQLPARFKPRSICCCHSNKPDLNFTGSATGPAKSLQLLAQSTSSFSCLRRYSYPAMSNCSNQIQGFTRCCSSGSEDRLIFGASLARPTLAFWLARYGFRPIVVERAPRLLQPCLPRRSHRLVIRSEHRVRSEEHTSEL